MSGRRPQEMAVPRIAIIDYRIMHTLQKCWVVNIGKEGLERGLGTSPTYLRWRDDLGVDDYRLEI